MRFLLATLVFLAAASLHAALPVPGRILSVEGIESLSTLSSFTVEVESPNGRIDLPRIIGQAASFPLGRGRTVQGVVQSISASKRTRQGVLYRLVIVPGAAAAHGQPATRLFQDLSALELATVLMQEQDVPFNVQVMGSYDSAPLWVQYGESDWDFLRRVLGEAGVYSYFNPAGALVLADRSAQAPILGVTLNAAAGAELHFGLSSDPDQAALSGSSGNPLLAPGYRIRVTGHPLRQANQTYFITRVTHHMSGGRYSNEFQVIPAGTAYRPAVPPRPVVTTAETARITGPANQAVHVDALARVRIRFPWQGEGGPGVWARLLQPSTRSQWLPEIGEEVLVAFDQGDLRRPVVVGSMHDAQHPPPYPLPEGSAVTAIRASTPGGSRFSELMLGSQPGAELVRIRSAKDLQTIVANDHALNVGGNQAVEVGNHQVLQVGSDRALQIGANRQTSVGGNSATSIAGNNATSIAGNSTTTITGNSATSITGNSTTSARSLVIRAAERIVLQVGNQRIEITRQGIRQSRPPARPPAARKQQ